MVRRRGGPACTTGYAIAQGAVKLLLRGAIDLDKAVDNIIRSFTQEGYPNVLLGRTNHVDSMEIH